MCFQLVDKHSNGLACDDCWNETRIFTGEEMCCEKCGYYLGDAKAPFPVRCHKCEAHRYEKAFAAGIYEKAIAVSVLSLKHTPALSTRSSSILTEAFERTGLSTVDVLVPVPLSRQRMHERGFNQSETISLEISKKYGIPTDALSLVRSKDTRIHRKGMDYRARELSVKGCFDVRRRKLIEGKRIMLIDDVLTSGMTASACAEVLKRNGASEVWVFTFARAVLDR